MSLDMGPLLEGFPYREGEVVARTIIGVDQREKIQLRIEYGIIQVEADGHPGDLQPFEHESLLHYHLHRLEAVREVGGDTGGFLLSAADCAALREEAVLYYLRYVCCINLHDWSRALRDTERNLKVLDLCRKFGETDEDRNALERYRPYVLMMRARARAGQLSETDQSDEAERILADAATEVREMLRARGAPSDLIGEDGVIPLAELLEEFDSDSGQADLLRQLKTELRSAIGSEDYKRAATLRDEIRRHEEEIDTE